MNLRFCADCDAYQDELVGPSAPQYRTDTLVFGANSRLVSLEQVGHVGVGPCQRSPWTDNPAYQGAVLGLCILFFYLLDHYRHSIALLIKMQTRRTPLEKVYEEQTRFFKSFLGLSQSLLVGIVCCSLLRLAVYGGVEQRFPLLLGWRVYLLLPMLVLGVCSVILFRRIATRLIAALSQNRFFFSRYRFMNRAYSTLAVLALTPPFLMCALTNGRVALFSIYALIFLSGILILGYLTKSYRFFMERNVSILHWILYLCAIEIFPISFFLLIGLRHWA